MVKGAPFPGYDHVNNTRIKRVQKLFVYTFYMETVLTSYDYACAT